MTGRPKQEWERQDGRHWHRAVQRRDTHSRHIDRCVADLPDRKILGSLRIRPQGANGKPPVGPLAHSPVHEGYRPYRRKVISIDIRRPKLATVSLTPESTQDQREKRPYKRLAAHHHGPARDYVLCDPQLARKAGQPACGCIISPTMS